MPTGSPPRLKEIVPIDNQEGNDSDEQYPVVFTQIVQHCNPGKNSFARRFVSCTAIIGYTAHIDPRDGAIAAIEDGLYILNITHGRMNSRSYDGIAGFFRGERSHFAVVFPDMHILPKMGPITRWRFQHLLFEYPRGRKRGFLLPTTSTMPFAYGFISQVELDYIEHLCPPEPIARYAPEEFGHSEDSYRMYLKSEERKLEHSAKLLPILEGIFERIGGDASRYTDMRKSKIPAEYRDYDLLYGADILGGWDDGTAQ